MSLVCKRSLLEEYSFAVTVIVPLKSLGAPMNALSKSFAGRDHRVGLKLVPSDNCIPSTNPSRITISCPELLLSEIPIGIGSFTGPVWSRTAIWPSSVNPVASFS
jgi:hypothetical protein